jgi:hypothetical protein
MFSSGKHYSTSACLAQAKFSSYLYTDLVFILFYRTSSLLQHRLHQVARPISPTPASPLANLPWWLRHRRFEVGGPLGVSVIVGLRSEDLSASPSSSSSGRQTSLQLHRRLFQVARPPSGSVVAFVRLLDLPMASVVVLVRSLNLPPAFIVVRVRSLDPPLASSLSSPGR